MTTTTFTSGSGSWTVPAGVSTLQIEIWGGGGGGAGGGDGGPQAGGGSGGYSTRTGISVTSGVTVVNYVVGTGGTTGITNGNGSNGGNTTANISALGVSMFAGGGKGGIDTYGGIGGTASGGTINTAGNTAASGGPTDGASAPNGGAGGTAGSGCSSIGAGSAPGGGGGGGDYCTSGSAGGGGGAIGRITFTYTIVPGSTYDETGSGGVITGGVAFVRRCYRTAGSGGAITGGISNVNKISNRTASGGAVTGGVAVVGIITDKTASGGVITGGTSLVKRRYLITGSGGVITGGTVFTFVGYRARGGVITGGIAAVKSKYVKISSGGAKTGGHGKQKRFYSVVSSTGKDDAVTISGSADCGITASFYETSGGIEMGGVASCKFNFNVDLSLSWNIRQKVEVDTTFLWNTGNSVNYWYRIIAKDKCNHDPCCQRYILNVHARSQSELCGKLTKRGFNFTIESVQQFTTPADTVVAAALPDPDKCDTFVDIPICNIPLCAEFCVNYDEVVEVGLDVFVQINAFFHHVATNGVSITGAADCSFDRMLPDFPHVARGGITMGGDADCVSFGYNFKSTGIGITIGGIAGIRSTVWSYIGGQWPSETLEIIGESTQSIEELTTDQPWSLTDRALIEDGLFSSVDISYAKTSEFLVVEGFRFDIPEDSTILHIIVTVRRKSNQLGVRDLEAYIFNDEDVIISDNMGKTSVDWPYMIESATTYDFTDEFDVDEINAGFGFALRIKATVSIISTIAMVDVITAQVVYETAQHQKILMGGEARIKSTAFSWVAGNSDLQFSIGADCRKGMKYRSNGIGITVGGRYSYGLNHEASGGVEMGGDSACRPSYQIVETSGGVKTGGVAIVKPYYEFGSGGMIAGSSGVGKFIYKVVASGGVKTGGSNNPLPTAFYYVATGGPQIIGTASLTSNSWNFVSDGNVVFVEGSANCRSSNFGDQIQEMRFDMTIDNVLVKFAGYESKNDAVNLNEVLVRCGCLDLPLILNLDQSIAQNNSFTQFLNRNKLGISNRLKMQYNVPNDSWQSNLYYKGLSSDANSYETWSVMFDMQCTQNLGAIFIGRQIWRFSIEVVRKNLTTGQSFATRIVVGILPDNLCAANELNFSIEIDTQTLATEVTPNATVYQSLIYDEIGMFKNAAWIADPLLNFAISQVGLTPKQQRIDLTTQITPPNPALTLTVFDVGVLS